MGGAFLTGDDIRIFLHAAKHCSQWPWRRDFPTCCRLAFPLPGRKSSRASC